MFHDVRGVAKVSLKGDFFDLLLTFGPQGSKCSNGCGLCAVGSIWLFEGL
jgi:hypothetical protein